MEPRTRISSHRANAKAIQQIQKNVQMVCKLTYDYAVCKECDQMTQRPLMQIMQFHIKDDAASKKTDYTHYQLQFVMF